MGFVAVTPELSLNDFTSISPWSLLDNHNTLLLVVYSWHFTFSRLCLFLCCCPLFLWLKGLSPGPEAAYPNLPLCLAAFLTSSLQLLQSKQDDPCCFDRTFQFGTKSTGSWGWALWQGWSSQPQKALLSLETCLYQEPPESTLFNIHLSAVLFRIRIQAVNEIGAGPFSHFIKAKTRPLPPLPPRLECAAAGPQSLKLKWGDSSSKLHSTDDMVYILQIEDRNKG